MRSDVVLIFTSLVWFLHILQIIKRDTTATLNFTGFSQLVLISADSSQLDCQTNEIFVTCGHCEGTCANHRPTCDKTCRGNRCECVAARGFVRSRHGHCIHCTECPGASIYSEDPYMMLRMNAIAARELFRI